ncbi:MAG: HDOD domain-containing protein, partial [Phycisphaerales bacterium JB039]
MTKPRCQLSAAEVDEVLALIDRRLDAIGIDSRPEIVARMLDLVGDPSAGLADYARVIKTDMAMTGRLLKIANSAHFGQTQPVTSLERACVILGIERIRSIGLGFYLSRSAASDEAFSRVVWGQSVFRANLCARLASAIGCGLGSEAFVVGLMMDAGLPLLRRLLGAEAFDAVHQPKEPPTRQFRREFDTLPYTRDDVVSALCRRWKMPPVLSRPLEWRHIAPADTRREEPEHVLHRIAYYAGAVHLGAGAQPHEALPLPSMAVRYLGLDHNQLTEVFARAVEEYNATEELFRSVADRVGDLDGLAATLHARLTGELDAAAARSIAGDMADGPQRFELDVASVEFDRDYEHPGWLLAFLVDSRGRR